MPSGVPAELDDELAGLATALTGYPGRAAELLGEVLALAARPAAGDEPPELRGLLIARFLGRGRAPAAADADTDAESAPSAEHRPADELAAVRQQLDRLAPLPRAVLVLRVRERLTLHELAALVDRPVATVGRLLEQAEQAVGAAPYEIQAALATDAAVDPAEVRAAGRRFAVRRRRRRGRVALASATAVVLLVAAVVVPNALRQSRTYLRPYGAWVHGVDLEPGRGWQLSGRTLTADRDRLIVRRSGDQGSGDPGSGNRRRNCMVDLVTSTSKVTTPEGKRVGVQGVPGVLVRGRGAANPYLWWAVGPNSAVIIGCSDGADEQMLLELASLVRLRPVPLQLPFDLSGVADDLTVRFVATRERAVVALDLPAGSVARLPTTVLVTMPGAEPPPGREPRQQRSSVQVRGEHGSLTRTRFGGMSLCWPVQGSTACVSAYVFPEAVDRRQTRLRARVDEIALQLVFAPSVRDQATWFDARQALPS